MVAHDSRVLGFAEFVTTYEARRECGSSCSVGPIGSAQFPSEVGFRGLCVTRGASRCAQRRVISLIGLVILIVVVPVIVLIVEARRDRSGALHLELAGEALALAGTGPASKRRPGSRRRRQRHRRALRVRL